jgi:uncharacterized Tic20 family protein
MVLHRRGDDLDDIPDDVPNGRAMTAPRAGATPVTVRLPRISDQPFPVGRADRVFAAFYHLSALCWLVVPFGHFIGPLLAWPHARGQSQFARDHLKGILLFQGWAVIYFVSVYLVTGLVTGIFVLGLLAVWFCVCSLLGSVAALRGQEFFYPMVPPRFHGGALVLVCCLFMFVAIGYASIWVLEGGQLEIVAEQRKPPPPIGLNGGIATTAEEIKAARAAMRLTDTDFAYYGEISAFVYQPDATYIQGWKWTSLKRGLNTRSGFYGQLFRHQGGTLAIAYRGTVPSTNSFLTDLTMGLGLKTQQFLDAEAFYLQAQRDYPGEAIVLTGHSLGGSLAQYVGAKYNDRAITFNAFGIARIISAEGIHKQGVDLTSRIFNLVEQFDVVSTLQLPYTLTSVVRGSYDFATGHYSNHVGCKVIFGSDMHFWRILELHSVKNIWEDVEFFNSEAFPSELIRECPSPLPLWKAWLL